MNPREPIDVALLLEGTYPYIRGGVSAWVHQIIGGFPDIRFGVVFLGGSPDQYGKPHYQFPKNVVHFEEHYLHSRVSKPTPHAIEGDAELFQAVRAMHARFASQGDGQSETRSSDMIGEGSRIPTSAMPARTGVAPATPPSGANIVIGGGARAEGPAEDWVIDAVIGRLGPDDLSYEQFLNSREAWDFIADMYRSRCTDPSFVDYFWTIRTMHEPIWVLADIATRLPPARAYHSVSTGYAGFLGSLLARRTGRPLILSEHGIYTKERKIDLFQSTWIKDNRDFLQKDPTQVSYFRQIWIRFFETLGRMTYGAADPIIALYENNRLRQIDDGAIAERTSCIPNGIDLPRFAALRPKRAEGVPQVLCLIGRVVPIKDVKTFIRAMRYVVNRLPDSEGWIAGPTDEDPDYFQECRNLVESLGLQDKVKFLGFQKVEDVLPRIGLNVLTSISEALPLVLLEAYAAGVPAVSTDVGSCRQLVHGAQGEDEAIGQSGRIVGIADPRATAEAAVELLSDPGKWKVCQQAAIRRVETFYTQERMFGSYREVYRSVLERSAGRT